NTPADVAAVQRIIEYIQKELAVAAEMQIELVELEVADATALSDFLSEFFSRVSIGVGGNLRTIQPQPNPFFGFGAQPDQFSSVIMFPYQRFNALLIAAPKQRMPDVIAMIKK